MFVCAKHLTFTFFFSAYDFQPCPRRGGTTTILPNTLFINPNPGADHIEGYFSGGETEEEWLDDAQLVEVSAQFASRVKGQGVCFPFDSLSFQLITCRRSHLMIISPLLEQFHQT